MNIHLRRQVPLRPFQLTEPAGLVPSWLTIQDKHQHAWPSNKGKTVWPSHFPFSNLLGLYQLGPHQQSLRPQAGEVKAMEALYWEKATKLINCLAQSQNPTSGIIQKFALK